MATRYFARADVLYVSQGPKEHTMLNKAGFKSFSPYDAVRFDSPSNRVQHCPAGFTLEHMRRLSDLGRSGRFGSYQLDTRGQLHFIGERIARLKPGQFELQHGAPSPDAEAAKVRAAKAERSASAAPVSPRRDGPVPDGHGGMECQHGNPVPGVCASCDYIFAESPEDEEAAIDEAPPAYSQRQLILAHLAIQVARDAIEANADLDDAIGAACRRSHSFEAQLFQWSETGAKTVVHDFTVDNDFQAFERMVRAWANDPQDYDGPTDLAQVEAVTQPWRDAEAEYAEQIARDLGISAQQAAIAETVDDDDPQCAACGIYRSEHRVLGQCGGPFMTAAAVRSERAQWEREWEAEDDDRGGDPDDGPVSPPPGFAAAVRSAYPEIAGAGSASTFEAAIAVVEKVGNMSPDEIAGYQDRALSLGRTSMRSAGESAQAISRQIAAGYRLPEHEGPVVIPDVLRKCIVPDCDQFVDERSHDGRHCTSCWMGES